MTLEPSPVFCNGLTSPVFCNGLTSPVLNITVFMEV